MPKFSGRFLWMAPYALHSDAAKNQKNVETGDMERGYLSYSKKVKVDRA